MRAHRVVAVLAAVAFVASPIVGTAADKQIKDVKELAGTWEGWVKSQLGSDARAKMIVKEDGSYESATQTQGGTLTVGKFYLDSGKLRWRSSRTEGRAAVSEDKGKTLLTLTPEGSVTTLTGPASYERVK